MDQSQELFSYFHTLKKHSCIGVGYTFIGEDFSQVPDIIKLINCQDADRFCNSCWDCKRIDEANHPDLLTIEPQGLTIKIEAIREAIRFLSLKSFRLTRKAIVIKGAQNLTPQAAAAFLKTLEEAPDNSFIALCMSKLDGVPATIISRCRKIFLPFSQNSLVSSDRELIFDLFAGRDLFFKDRKEFSVFLWGLIALLHTDLLVKKGGRNNQLSNYKECAIILNSYSPSRISSILEDLLKIYSAHGSVNINLALNLIKAKLK
ncbi:MAG: hypothetical protein K9L86_00735 [Candidatus Omnitrophica bacterium]|nr:hypothetical protein [Candidatus Omnitrophota bacterium]